MTQFKLKSTRGFSILIATTVASGLGFLASSALNIAIPDMQDDLDATLLDIQWILNSYAIFAAGLILTAGALGDSLGRKRLFLIGTVIFTIGTIFSAFVPQIWLLIIFRAIQGVGAALMVPQSLSLINVFIVPENRGLAIGLWSGLSGALNAIGPILGGILTDEFGWRSVFYIQIPFVIIVFVAVYLLVPKDPVEKKAVDWVGSILISAALLILSASFIQGGEWGILDVRTIALFVLGVALVVIFVMIETSLMNKLFEFSILKDKTVLGANIVTLFIYFTLSGIFFFLSLNFIQLQGYSAAQAGLALIPTIVIMSLFSWVSGFITDKIGARMLMTIGCLIVAAALFLLALSGQEANYLIHFLPSLLLFGIGMTLIVPALTKSALAVSENLSGSASGLNNTIARVAGVIAVALLGTIATLTFDSQLNDKFENIEINETAKIEILDQTSEFLDIDLPKDLSIEEESIVTNEINESFVFTFRVIMILGVVLAVIGSVVSFVTIDTKTKSYSQ